MHANGAVSLQVTLLHMSTTTFTHLLIHSSLTTMTPHVLTHLDSLSPRVPRHSVIPHKHTLQVPHNLYISTPQAVSPVQAKAAIMRTWLKRTAPPKCNFTDSGGSISRSVSVSAGSSWDIDQQDREWLQRRYPNAQPGKKRSSAQRGQFHATFQ